MSDSVAEASVAETSIAETLEVSDSQTNEIIGEKQYHTAKNEILASGYERFGLMTSWAWRDDPKRLTFTFARYKFVSKMLSGRKNVVEFGCGDGFASRIVRQSVQRLTGVDFDSEFIKDATQNTSKEWPIHFKCHNLLEGPVDEIFDAAYSLDVLEHIPEELENIFIENMLASLTEKSILILGMPSLQSQPYASPKSKEGHVNCKDQLDFKRLMEKYFDAVLMFSMNDEVVHTGYHPMAHYNIAVCIGKKVAKVSKIKEDQDQIRKQDQNQNENLSHILSTNPLGVKSLIKPFCFTVVVWGEEYVWMLLNITIPSLLSNLNIPSLPNLKQSNFVIATTAEDYETITKHPIYEKLKAYLDVVFVELPKDNSYWNLSVYDRMSIGFKKSVEKVISKKPYCIFLTPDSIFSDGTIAHLTRLARLGKRAVVVSGLRVTKESFFDTLNFGQLLKEGVPLSIKPRDLVAMGLKNIHVDNQSYNWDASQFSLTPHLITWNVPGEKGLLMRAFHLHPLMVDVSHMEDVSIKGNASHSEAVAEAETEAENLFWTGDTIDGDFLGHNIGKWQDIHVETDSDNIVMYTFTKAADRLPKKLHAGSSIDVLKKWAFCKNVNPLHRHYVNYAIKFHVDDLNNAWDAVEEESGKLIYAAQKEPKLYLEKVSSVELLKACVERLVGFLRRKFGM